MEKQKFEVMRKVQRTALRLASRTGFAYLLQRGFERPEWLYRADCEIPQYELTFSPGSPPTPADVALCGRLLAAYQRACPEPIGNTGIAPLWSEIIDDHYQPLLRTLEQGNAQSLAQLLSTVFQQGSSMGLTYGDDYKHTLNARFWYLKILNDLVSLAEYLGVVRTENPEQGTMGHAFKDGPEALVKAIEQACGQELGFPAVGGPYGIQIGQSMITMETSEHTYAALRVNQALERNLPAETRDHPAIVEIGAGFGGTAYRLLKLRKERTGSYTSIDLPMMNVLQGYFLGSLFGPDRIALYGEHHPGQEAQRPIRVMPTVFINKMVERNIDLLLNENSMPEMPESTVEEYIRWARRVVRGVFYSYNQETDRPAQGVPQVLVPAVVNRVGGFRRISRDLSWIRRGYVEEVYLRESQS